jgi:phospho-N-acetylmuramoyl-pentapeptide-transferase
MIDLFSAGFFGLVVSIGLTPMLIRWLQQRGIGQHIRDDGPERHALKAGTPTMGGLAILAGLVAGYVLAHLVAGAGVTRAGILALVTVLGCGAVGGLDDWLKVRHRRNLGLNKRAKLAGQLVVGVGFALGALYWSGINRHLSFTRFDSLAVVLARPLWVVFAVLVVTGSANAVNLTDGLDGLAAGAATLVFAVLAVVGYWQFRHAAIYHVLSSLDLALLAAAMVGSLIGFLWWNAAPARIFMGDVGSLALGGGLAVLGLEMNLDLLLPILGGLFVLETLSVILQIVSYRCFGRRVLRMAPLHHHFELRGWPETTVIVRLWIVAGICAALALGIFYADFLSVSKVA